MGPSYWALVPNHLEIIWVAIYSAMTPTSGMEVARQIIGRRGTDATVLHDHHGIAIQSVGGVARVAFPVNLHDKPPSFATGAPSDYFSYTQTGLYRFDIDMAAGTLAAKNPVIAPNATSNEPNITGDRAVLVGDQVHYLRDSTFISGAW